MSQPPQPSYITTWQQAEALAWNALIAWGYRDARLTRAGADGGIDVEAAHAVAQVKWRGAAVGRPDLQRLMGARRRPDAHPIFFTASAFTKHAIEYANQVGMSLFTFDPLGRVFPANQVAAGLLEHVRQQQANAVSRRPLWRWGRGAESPATQPPRPTTTPPTVMPAPRRAPSPPPPPPEAGVPTVAPPQSGGPPLPPPEVLLRDGPPPPPPAPNDTHD